jgi:uncharacterized protein involved in type VI secretion and phage assembly
MMTSDYPFSDPVEFARFFGVVVGKVTNNRDPLYLGRVKVSIPSLFGEADESNWATVMTPMAGEQFGVYFLPEIDDRVLVAFENGMPDSPYVLGSVWGFGYKPPEKNENSNNNLRLIRSRSGHQITLDDTEDQEKITISDKTGNNIIAIDSSTNTISITSDQDLSLNAKGNINLSSERDVSIECSGTLKLKAGNTEITAGQNKIVMESAPASLEIASQGVSLKHSTASISANGTTVNINEGALEVT